MAHYIQARDSLSALGELLMLTLQEGDRVGDKLEVLSVLLSIGAGEDPSDMEIFLGPYRKIVGNDSWKRAETLYKGSTPLRWKVSYRGRLIGGGRLDEEDQLADISRALSRTPGANTLSFAFYRPSDHRRARALPASMPCPLGGDFKCRRGRLHLNVFFRTHDVYRLGFPDLYFMRDLQAEILGRATEMAPTRFGSVKMGELNVFFSRAFVFSQQRVQAERLARTVLASRKDKDGTNDANRSGR